MRTTQRILILAVIFLAQSAMAQGRGMGNVTVERETICGGAFLLRPAGDFVVGVTIIRNMDTEATIEILHIRAWDEDGILLYDSDSVPLPTNPGFKSTIQPFQRSVIPSPELVPLGSQGVQIRITYQHNLANGDPLRAISSFLHNTGSPSGPTQARTSVECVNVDPK